MLVQKGTCRERITHHFLSVTQKSVTLHCVIHIVLCYEGSYFTVFSVICTKCYSENKKLIKMYNAS